jgi:(1->4)-alpha-D-glucan 1-alpha-D-glucosylmutase
MPTVRATYRLQFNKEFTFEDGTRLIPYLADLGISHLYASPLFTAAPGSMHGYNVVDYGEINPEIGTREDFDRMVSTLHQHGMGLIIDFVPNHMGIENGANPWWQDVVENGQMSRYAEYFDIDWSPIKRELQGKVMLPFLGGQYGEVLERGELALTYVDGGFHIQYFETAFPIDPQTFPFILQRARERVADLLAPDDLELLAFESVITAFDRLPVAVDHPEPDRETVEARYREQVVTRMRIAELYTSNEPIRTAIDATVAELNGTTDDPRSFDALDQLLSRQNFRLAFWRVAAEEINYRRFFAINSLAAIRQEEAPVFEDTHRLLIALLADGAVDGVRFDHPDGLWNPEQYFEDVQRAFVKEAVRRRLKPESEDVWQELQPALDNAIGDALEIISEADRNWPVWVIGEKILEHGEVLPPTWQIAGTVGYEFAQAVTGLYVDAESKKTFDAVYGRYTGDKIRFPDLVYDMKMQMLREGFPSEMNVLTNILNRISERDRHSRDFTLNSLRWALREVIACFSVYRSYTTCEQDGVLERDRKYITQAVALAKRRNSRIDPSVFDFIESVLLLHPTDNPRARADERCHFAMKLQQLTGPVMAKGLEDTAFYRFNRLVSLNEVGGDPAKFGTSVDEFHKQNRARLRDWPDAMINSSTHDTKRSEDVRARISVLSERPTEWRAALNRWTRLNRKLKLKIDGALAPHRVDEYVIYQTLVGTWPLEGLKGIDKTYVERIQEYIVKVAREASRFTNWVSPDERYESALRDFVAGMLNRRRSRQFIEDMHAFVETQLDAGLLNGLAQQVLKLTSPGVPDVYQGTEFWDDSLVDPDNRRHPDFDARVEAVRHLDDADVEELLRSKRDGRIKLYVTGKLLRFRREQKRLLERGDYVPVKVEGGAAEHVVAYLRASEEAKILVVAPRLAHRLAHSKGSTLDDRAIWLGTTLQLPESVAGETWTNLLTGETVDGDPASLEKLFVTMPLAVLVSVREEATNG